MAESQQFVIFTTEQVNEIWSLAFDKRHWTIHWIQKYSCTCITILSKDYSFECKLLCLHVDDVYFMTHLSITNFVCPRFLHGCMRQLFVLVFLMTCVPWMAVIVLPQKGDNFVYLQRLNPNTLQRYRLEREEPGLSPLSFSASYRDKHVCLLYLCKPQCPVSLFDSTCFCFVQFLKS